MSETSEREAERWDEFRSFLDGYDMPDWVYVDADALLAELAAAREALRAVLGYVVRDKIDAALSEGEG